MGKRTKPRRKMRAVLDAQDEQWASRSKYGRKAWERDHGRPPNPHAVGDAKKDAVKSES